MIVERLPEVLALSTEEKEILAEELLNQVVLEQDKDPALVDLLRRRLNDHHADPKGGVPWGELRDRLLKRGGCDCPANMQWQTKAAAKAKDKWE